MEQDFVRWGCLCWALNKLPKTAWHTCRHEVLEQSAERYIYISLSLSLFYRYLKLPQATQKGKRSKEGFEVTPQRYFGILQYARRHNHSFSLKQVSHAVFGSLFKAKHKQDPHLTKSCSTWGSVHYLRERKLVNRKTYSSNPFAPPLIKKKQTSKPVMPPSYEKQTEFPPPPTLPPTPLHI